MKNNIVSNWAALLLTVSGMAALPLSTSAQLQPSGQFLVSGSAVIQSSTGYTTLSSVSVDNGHALRVIGASSSYSGTNITLRPGRDWSSGAHVEDGATVVLHDSSVFLPAINSNGLNVTGTGSRLDTYNVYVSASGQPDSVSMAALVKVSNGAQFTMSGGTLTGDSRLSAAIRVENAVAEVDGITIDNSGYDAHAAYVLNGGTLNITNSQINLSGSNARFIAGSGGAINGENLTITTYAEALEAGGANASLVVVSSSIRTTATGTRAAIQAYNGGAVTVRDSDIAASNNLIGFQRDTASVTLENVRATNQGRAIMVDASASGTHTVNLVNTDLAGEVKNSGSGSLIVNLADNALNGDIVGAGSGTTIITGSDGATITGHVTGSDNSTVTIGGNGDIIIGDVTGSGSATIDIGLTGTTSGVTGDITGNGDSSITITGSNGAIITGTISGDGNAVIDIIVSGSTGGLIGDITQSGSSAVTVTLDDGATGQGSFNGGDLNLGPGSEWTITDDSHLNTGDNSGTLIVGDHQVTVDHLTNDGTITIDLNDNNGTGGSITITGTADGGGTIHINTTGDGNADPNQVLPGKVTGDGTEHWRWDPIDWGIDTIIKDGDHFVKNGISPAGAVLNSSMAIQQAMWFAQQNSLLKRMGELRYGARASRPPAGGTPALHNLIDNIWIRSYGQQLNIGSQVAGKAYEQLIYGVDLGTDHKFTISADSDLYLGVYAGYGRSDIDYRTPGADGEINSYYGGLYATWLHSSGFYIDATVKAASVDNDLKAPYGNTQLKANYSDVNLGGSLELLCAALQSSKARITAKKRESPQFMRVGGVFRSELGV